MFKTSMLHGVSECVMWHDLRRMCWLGRGFHGIPIDPIPITFNKSPPCKAYLHTPQSNFHKSLQHDTVSEPRDLWVKEGGHTSAASMFVIDLEFNSKVRRERLINTFLAQLINLYYLHWTQEIKIGKYARYILRYLTIQCIQPCSAEDCQQALLIVDSALINGLNPSIIKSLPRI